MPPTILGNVASGKLEREYIARGSALLLCDSGRNSHGTQLQTPSLASVLLGGRFFQRNEASFRTECAT